MVGGFLFLTKAKAIVNYLMKVLAPNYSGSISLYTREHSQDIDYLFVLFDEQINKAYSYKIDSSAIVYDGFKTTFNIDVETEVEKFYNYQLFTQDGSVTDSEEESDVMRENIFALYIAENVIEEIANGKIFCTTQTDLERFEMNKGSYTSQDTENDYVIV
jgi:hypothetical protein